MATATSGHGYDAKTVWIGVITQKDTQTTFSKLGAANFDTGDTEKQATAIAADINAHGGILGRQVKLRFHDVDIVAAQTNNGTTAQAVCTDFVQDNPVVAVWNASTQLDQASTLRTCLAKAGVMLWTAAARGIGDNLMKQMAPYYFHTVMVSWDPLATTLVTRLKAQGWFSGWNTTLARPGTAKAKVGILVDGTPQGAHTATALKNALTQAGYPGSLSYSYTDPGQGQNSSAYYFKANGVTNVIVTDVELTAFQTSASQNAYYPRYGITTYNDPYANLEQSGATPANSMNGALGVGWAPNLDVSDQNSPPVSTAEKHCLAVVAKQESYSSSQRLAKAFASSLCDTLYLIARGATQSRSLTGPGIAAGVFATAKSYQPANGFAPALTATSPYVQGSVRDLQWDSSCSCLKYGRTVTALRT